MDRRETNTLVAIAVGGIVGASARWGVGTLLTVAGDGFPWPTFVVNIIGALAIGVAAARLDRNSIGWAFAVTGALGGFTTMSAFAVELNGLADAEQTATLVLYLVGTLGAGLAALLLGERSAGGSQASIVTDSESTPI